MPELAEPRQQAILDLLNSGGHAVVSALARRLDVSEMTIRRDLRFLESRGLAVRVHGGALAGEKSRFSNRLSANSRAKAKAVAKFVPELPERGCVYFDGSTTVLNLVRHLKDFVHLQVATNHIETFNRIAALRGPVPVLIGGSLDIRTDNLIGPLALRSIEALAFEKAFFSAWGLADGVGLSEVTMEDAQVKEQVAHRARQVYVAVDRSKIGVVAAGTWNHGAEKSVLATDSGPADETVQSFRNVFAAII